MDFIPVYIFQTSCHHPIPPPTSSMYSSSYSQAKFGLEGREPLHRSKGKSCGYYLRIMFFFSSLIQSLIIVSLVLFLIYGQPEKSAAEKRVKVSDLPRLRQPVALRITSKTLIDFGFLSVRLLLWSCEIRDCHESGCFVTAQELELTYNRLTENNIQLRKEKGELGSQLGARTAEKAALEKECEKLRTDFNKTVTDLKTKSVSQIGHSAMYWCVSSLTDSRSL